MLLSRVNSGKITNRKGWAINLQSAIRRLDAGQKQALIDELSGIINSDRQQLLRNILSQRTRQLTVVLEDIYQAQNASAVIRSAECMGIQEIHIIENTNPYQLNPAVVQGASKWMEIQRYKNPDGNNTEECLQRLRQRGYRLLAMTLRENSTGLDELDITEPLALCFGSEEPGLSDVAHQMADEFVQIPMLGFTQSLNLSVSAGISLYQLGSRLRQSSLAWQLSAQDQSDLYIDWLSRSTPTGRILLEKFIKELPGES